MPISTIGLRDVVDKVVRKEEARGAIDTAHRLKQLCGQVFRYAIVTSLAEQDVTTDLREALVTKTTKHHADITEPKLVDDLMRSIFTHTGHPATLAALKLTPLVFMRPGELRTMEWAELDLDAAEWRIPGSKMKMKVEHVVPLCTQALDCCAACDPLPATGVTCSPACAQEKDP